MPRPSASPRRGAILVVALGAILALAGCGGSSGGGATASSSAAKIGPTTGDLNPNNAPVQILAEASVALRDATSFRFDAKTVLASDGSTSETDVSVDNSGKATGRITQPGGQILLLVSDGILYVKGPAEYYTAQFSLPAASVAITTNMWVAAPVSDASFASLTSATTIGGIADSLFNNVSAASLYTTDVATVGGVKSIGITDGQGTTLYVALQGKPYPISFVSNPAAAGGTGNKGLITISNFGVPIDVQVPPADQIVQWSSIPKS